MAATTTVSITSLVKQLRRSYPQFNFVEGDEFHYSPPETVTYHTNTPDAVYLLLHELGHALCKHDLYERDIELISIESRAWEQAAILSPTFGLVIPDEVIQSSLDSYRDWMHARSKCPECDATGVQTSLHTFTCIACHKKWRVNTARTCELRRYTK